MINEHKYVVSIPTTDGTFTATYSESGLCGLDFPGRTKTQGSAKLPEKVARWHRLTATALKTALQGGLSDELPPLDLSAGSKFQQSVWQAMRRIPSGKTLSYAAVARAIGSPKAVRAVGGACGANPIPVLVPCHRVVASNGLGGFGGGLDWKRRLLAREGTELDFGPSQPMVRRLSK